MTRNLIHLRRPRRRQHSIAFALLLALGFGWFVVVPPVRSGRAAEPAADAPALLKPTQLAAWGTEALTQIRKDLLQPGGSLYAEYGSPDGKRGSDFGRYAFIWPSSLQLRALAAAAKVQPRVYGKTVTAFADALGQYWISRAGIGGYAVLPMGNERYHDDNAYMVLALLDTFDVSKQRKYLARAEETFDFVASGEKKTPGGGIRQHEDKDGPVAVCATAPAIVGALRLYQHTRNKKLLTMAERWYAVLMSNEAGVRDANDGLFHELKEGKRAYQSAHVLNACLLFYEVTKDKKYLTEAQLIAKSAVAQWVQPDGSMKETGQWGGDDFSDAWLNLYEVDKDAGWLAAVHGMLKFLHEKGRDKHGRHGEHWNQDVSGQALAKFQLLYMAPATRAYWMAAAVKPAGS